MTQTLPAPATTPLNADWRLALGTLAALLALLGLTFWGTFSSIVAIWIRSETFAHGFLVVPMVAYLAWIKRRSLLMMRPHPTPLAALLLLLLSMIWLVAHVGDVIGVQQFAVVAMIPVLVWVVLGVQALRILAFPLGFLFFAVPFGDFLVPVLQDVTAHFAVKGLQLSGIPVYLEGRFFYIPSGSFEVAQGCSGIRYLIASVALGVLYAYLTYYTLWRRLVFIALATVVPIIANGMRAYGIVMLADLSDYKLAVGVDHLIYGWLFFGVVMLLLFWLGSLFRESVEAVPPESPVVAGEQRRPLSLKDLLPLMPVLLLMPSGPLVSAWLDGAMTAAPAVKLRLPAGVAGWEGPFPAQRPLGTTYYGAYSQALGEYRRDGHTVQLFAANYTRQQQGAELINTQNTLYDFTTWRRASEQQTDIALDGDQQWPLHATRLISSASNRLVWQWYMVDDQITAQPMMVKLYELQMRLSGVNPISSTVILTADYDVDVSNAQESLRGFMVAMLPAIRNMVDAVP
jgi:exosortase A